MLTKPLIRSLDRLIAVLALARATRGVLCWLTEEPARQAEPHLPIYCVLLCFVGCWLYVGRRSSEPGRLVALGLVVAGSAFAIKPLAMVEDPLAAVTLDAFFGWYMWRLVELLPEAHDTPRLTRILRGGQALSLLLAVAALGYSVGYFLSHTSEDSSRFSRAEILDPLGWSLASLAAAAVFFARYRRAPRIEQRRTRVLLPAFLALAATMALITLFETAARENVPNSLGLSAALLFVAFIAYPWIAQRSQAFRRRVPRLALYRTLQVGVWIASLAPLLPMLSAMTAGDSMDDKRIGGWALAALAGGALRPLGLQTLRRLYEGNKGAPADWLASALADLREATNGRSLDEALRRLGRESLRARDAQLWIVAGEPALGAQTLSSLSRLPEIFDLRDGAYNREEADPFAIEERLTDEDRSRLEDGDVALLTPARTAEGRTVALIAFSTKTTETPFRRDEVAAVNLLSSAVGLQLERFGRQQLQRTDEDAGDPGSLCIECGQIQAVDVYECCDLPTVETDVPRRLGERFLLEQQLGSGSFGTVYAARDLELHRAVAIKALDGSHSNGEALAREATAAARLSHPHVAAAYSLERQGGRKFLVTELLEGGTLNDRLDEGPLDARTTVALGLQIAEALRAAHDLGFTHGDVKPSNIGFTAGGTAKLIDLGLVSLVSEAKGSASPSGSELTSTRALPGGGMGTPIYASPETFAGNPAGSTDDLWSLNVVLWESLTGFNPFALGNLEKVSQAVLGGCQRDPRSAGAECSDALARLLLKGLAAHIGHRHVDAEDLLSDLRQAL